jgi:cell division protease FtsH
MDVFGVVGTVETMITHPSFLAIRARTVPRLVLVALFAAVSLLVLQVSSGHVRAAGVTADGASGENDTVYGTYADVLGAIADGDVLEASFDRYESLVVLTLVDGTRLESRYPSTRAPSLVVSLLEAGVRVGSLPDPLMTSTEVATGEAMAAADNPPASTSENAAAGEESDGGSFFGGFGPMLPLLMFVGFLIFIWRGRRRMKRDDAAQAEIAAAAEETGVTFADVAGCEEAIEDLKEIVEFLRAPERFERLGAKVPRGALLVGPPGTGKTLLAKAVAGEAGVAFFSAAGSDFVELYVGVGAKRIRELFEKANAVERAIVFIDEIDAVGRVRSTSPDAGSGAHVEQESTLIALLNELDGFKGTGVVVIGATNRPDILDPALVRPGRLERRIHVPNPDRRGRERILKVHTIGKPLAKDVDLSRVARRTPGTSGADLAHIANEAALEAARRELDEITQECFDDAVATVAMGRPRHSALVTERDRRITAWHEAGHALAALLEEHADDPVAVSITPRGLAGGVTWMDGSDDQFMSRDRAKAQLVVALAGRAGEEMLLDGEFTQGAQSDLVSATQLAEAMVTRFGMTRRGLQVRARFDGSLDDVSSDMVDELLETAMERARAIMSQNLTALESLSAALLEHDTLTADEIRAAVEGRVVAPKPRPVRRPSVTSPVPRRQVSSGRHEDGDRSVTGRLRRNGAVDRLLDRMRRRRGPSKQPSAG